MSGRGDPDFNNLAVAMGGMSMGGGTDRGDSSGDDGRRGGRGGPENMILPVLYTRPAGRENKKGEGGNPIEVLTNYIKLETSPEFCIYQYHLHFDPIIDSKKLRQELIRNRSDLFGKNPIFDGMILYHPNAFEEDPMIISATHPATNESIQITIKLTTQLMPDDPQCLTILNLCNRQVYELAGFVQLGRNFYNPNNIKALDKQKIEIWPGTISAIRFHERNLLMVCEMSHKILRTDTVNDRLEALKREHGPVEAHEIAMQELIGCTVLTRYNNKTYRIDDIMWDQNPTYGIPMDDGRTISFIEYYAVNYNKTITDYQQPLLMSRGKRRVAAGNDDSRNVYLVPELCAMTGLSDEMRANRAIMQELAVHTRVQPIKRIDHVRRYLQDVNSNSASADLFSRWGIRLADDILKVPARELAPEPIIFGRRTVNYNRSSSDWSRECRNIILNDPKPLTDWMMVFSGETRIVAERLFNSFKTLGSSCGMKIDPPKPVQTEDDSVRGYLNAIRVGAKEVPDLKMVLAVVPNDNKTRYDAIKKLCCNELMVPNQIMQMKSLMNEKIAISVASKILLQVNCKLGGDLWRLDLPLGNTMLIGYDLYHDSSSKNAKVGAAIFSMNTQFTKWYSQCAVHESLTQLAANLTNFIVNGLKKFEKVNGRLPDRVILFRDGVGDGHIPVVVNDELPQVRTAFKTVGGDTYSPRFAFIIITKRVHTRYFKLESGMVVNPLPGTVLDDVVTRSERYDFYLVPQSVRQGTVTPVSYNVIFDESGMTPKHMQSLAYKLCHLYYNWQGTIRVPAPCQYAHKLAFLVGQTLHAPVHEILADKLFFL